MMNGSSRVTLGLMCIVFSLGNHGTVTGQDQAIGDQTRPAVHAFRPGVVYREYTRHNRDDDWRVTDDRAVEKWGERASKFLPNPVLPISGVQLKGAIAAEMVLDRWGGHRGTINKRVRFNENEWITIPEIVGTPKDIRPENLMSQDNPVVEVPLDHLIQGDNSFQADCDEHGGFGWGQWGLYSMILRVYYDPEVVGERIAIDAELVAPRSGDVLPDEPVVEVAADSRQGIVRVEVVAHHDGYDEDGDGDFGGWHESRFQWQRGQPNDVRDHVGTLWNRPYRLTWDTHWVPDQPPGAVKLIARVQDADGYWTVTQPAENLTLRRRRVSVKLYRPRDVPQTFAVRVGQRQSCFFDVAAEPSLREAAEAAVHLRTWNGSSHDHSPIRLNDHEFPPGGKNHHYDYDLIEIPVSAIQAGENTFTIHSDTEHHMLEVLWPGPALVVRYNLDAE